MWYVGTKPTKVEARLKKWRDCIWRISGTGAAAQGKRTAYINANVLDGTQGMDVLENHVVVVEGRHITDVAPLADADLSGCETFDLKGAYLLPGLINMHVHLAGNGKPQKKQRDNEALVKKIMANGLTRAVAYRLVSEYARLELHSGVTTIRTVGGRATSIRACVMTPRQEGWRLRAFLRPTWAYRCREAYGRVGCHRGK